MCWGVRGDVGKGMRGGVQCKKVCWGVGKVRGDGEKGEEMWGSVGGSVLGPHTSSFFYTSPISLPTLP